MRTRRRKTKTGRRGARTDFRVFSPLQTLRSNVADKIVDPRVGIVDIRAVRVEPLSRPENGDVVERFVLVVMSPEDARAAPWKRSGRGHRGRCGRPVLDRGRYKRGQIARSDARTECRVYLYTRTRAT